MSHTFRHQLIQWARCVAIFPILAACASESRDEGAALATTTEGLEADSSQVSVTLTTNKTSFAAQDALSVTVTLTNGADHAVRLLSWKTPVNGIDEPLFSVTRDGMPVGYVGRVYKRAAPRAEDYVVLAPGESLARTVDLAEAYDVQATGNYVVHYRTDFGSNDVRLFVEGRPSLRTKRAPTIGTAHFRGCSAREEVTLREAHIESLVIARDATSYLDQQRSATPRYESWFGTWTPDRHSTVRDHFTKITNALDDEDFVFDCAGPQCKPGVFAYVYANEAGTIYFCDAFWNAPLVGTDSQSGTIVHETSHFDVIAATRDHAYGQDACRALATSDPDVAVTNADSHEYFVENNPPLE